MSVQKQCAALNQAQQERKRKAEALQALVTATRWVADCKLEEIIKVLAYFHNQHWFYLERLSSGEQSMDAYDSVAFQVITSTLTDVAQFKTGWPDVTIDELTAFCELMEGEAA
jgi:hypothetical protein